MKKVLKTLLSIIICASFLIGCNSTSNETLVVWCSEMDKKIVEDMVAEFIKTNPKIKEINVVVSEDDKAWESYENNPSATADVICIPHDQLGSFVDKNALLEISDPVYHNEINKNITPAVKAGQISGKQYGFPSSFETHMLFYDKSIISEQAVKSLEGILSSKVPEDNDITLFAMNFSDAYFSANWFFTYGCMLFGENGEDSTFCDFDSIDGVNAMTYLINNKDMFADCSSDEAIELFKERKLGAYIGGPWNAADMTAALKGNYGSVMLPSVEGMPMKSFAGYKLYVVNADTKAKTVAMDLAAWLANPDNQKIRFQARNLIPVSASLANDADVAVSTTAKAVMSQGQNALAMPSLPEMSNFWGLVGEFTEACYNGEINLNDLQEKLTILANTIKGID